MFISTQIKEVFVQELSSLEMSNIKPNVTELRNGRLDQFSDSFNLILGSINNEFDFFDNPYIEINVYERT
jgi:hypothetical protein